MYLQIRNRHLFISDIIMVFCAAYLSFVLRLDQIGLAGYLPGFLTFTVLALLTVPLSFGLTGIYRRYWRFASVDELLLLVYGLSVAVVSLGIVVFAGSWLLPQSMLVPRSVPIIFLLLAMVGTAGPRLLLRLVMPRRRHTNSEPFKAVLIMGAGNAGRLIVRELSQNPQLRTRVVGFVDDDRTKQGMHIHGVPVLGGRQDIPELVQRHMIKEVIIAMPAAPGKIIRDVVRTCESVGIQAKTMPGLYELLGGKVSVEQVRHVEIEDLLRRAPVQADTAAISDLLRSRRVLVTGGGGSIGSELCRQILRCGPAELIVLGHGENSVFEIQNELNRLVSLNQHAQTFTKVSAVIADIRFADRIQTVFEAYRPEIVFHAAAHKHVPLMEACPGEAVTNNILGTQNVLNAARSVDVDRFVMISSDKAVNPTNVMGASKRVAEMLVHQAAKASGKSYVAVRFGNVLGSRGSVVLTFKKQIADGGPITLTHPDMKRYFMTIPEAVTLVLQAGVLGNGGEVFVLDMGEPIKISDLAKDMIRLSGLEVGRDIDLVYTGTRPGEKLFEELFVKGETYDRTSHNKVFFARSASSIHPQFLDAGVADLAYAAASGDAACIRDALQALVPEYVPDGAAAKPVLQSLKTEQWPIDLVPIVGHTASVPA
jgi:FlaA1/EpsC-like NDP-sugar epimerase